MCPVDAFVHFSRAYCLGVERLHRSVGIMCLFFSFVGKAQPFSKAAASLYSTLAMYEDGGGSAFSLKLGVVKNFNFSLSQVFS